MPEGEEKEQEIGNPFQKIMQEVFPNLVKEIDMQVQEAQSPKQWIQRDPLQDTSELKWQRLKIKRILKAEREKLVTYRRVPIRLSADFSKVTLQARINWQEIFKVMERRDLQPRLLYPAKLSCRTEGQIKSFPNKKKLMEFIITKPLLHEMLKGVI